MSKTETKTPTPVAEAVVLEQKVNAPAVVDPAPLVPQQIGISPIVQLISSGGLDPATVDTLLDVQMKHEKNEARKAYHLAMAEFRKVAPVIGQDSHVQFSAQGGNVDYRHASLGYAMVLINPLLGACGLSPSWKLDDTLPNNQIRVVCVVTHALGHSEETGLQSLPDDKKGMNPLQKKKSAISYLERTTLFAILGLAENKDDDGQASGDPVAEDSGPVTVLTDAQAHQIEVLLENSTRSLVQTLHWISGKSGRYVGSIADIPSEAFNSLERILQSAQKSDEAAPETAPENDNS